jgi:hypothetical protein
VEAFARRRLRVAWKRDAGWLTAAPGASAACSAHGLLSKRLAAGRSEISVMQASRSIHIVHYLVFAGGHARHDGSDARLVKEF